MQYTLPFIRIGQCSGFCPFHFRNGIASLAKEQKSFGFVSIIMFLIQFSHLVHSLTCMDVWLSRRQAILSYIYFISPMISRTQVFVMIIECYLLRSNQVQIINSINLLNDKLKSELKIKNNRKKVKTIFWCIVCFGLFQFSLTMASLLKKRAADRRYYNLLFFVPAILKHPFNSLTIIYIYSLWYNIQLINDHLRSLKWDIRLFGLEEKHFQDEINCIKKYLSIIWKTVKLIEKWIFWSFLIAFIFNLISIISTTYWIFVHFFKPTLINDNAFVNGILWLFGSSVEMLFICDACSRIVRAVSV